MSALTLDDFLRINKENRAEDAALRAQERSEDFKKFNSMIEDSVKSHVGAAIEPVVERQSSYENNAEERLGEIEKKLDKVMDFIATEVDFRYINHLLLLAR